MQNSKTIHYCFEVTGHEPYECDVEIRRDGPVLAPAEGAPDWTKLEFHQCEGCELRDSEHCPVALRLVEPATLMNEFVSFDRVKVTVETQERSYQAETDIQTGLMALFGLIMATSGCPTMEPMRPMAWYHLPFARFDETLFRTVSAHLLRNYFSGNLQNTSDDIREEIEAIYAAIGRVNRGVMARLRASAAMRQDSSYNAITTLDAYATMISLSLEDSLEELRDMFKSTEA